MATDLNAAVGTVTRDASRHVGVSIPQTTWANPTYVNDGNDTTKATIASGNDGIWADYLKSDLGADYEVSAYNISAGNSPDKIGGFGYSLDGTSWTALTGTETGARSTLAGATFTFTAPITARYWAINASATGFHGSIEFNRWEIIGDPPSGPDVEAAFSGTPRSGIADLDVDFEDASTGEPDTWAWDFGDGGTSTSQNPSHTYTAAGTYTVELVATRSGDASTDTETKVAYITVHEARAGVLIDWDSDGFDTGDHDDVSSHVMGWTITRGASAELTGGSQPGTATVTLQNPDDIYNPRNASSPLYGLLRDGAPIWIGPNADGAITGDDPRGLFGGRIADITPVPAGGADDSPTVEITCEDMLTWGARMTVQVDYAEGRSHRDLRLAALASAGETRYALDNEIHTMPLSHADTNLTSVLDDINAVNGTRHYVHGTDFYGDWYEYVTRNRQRALTGVSVGSLDAASEHVTAIDGMRQSADTVINQQKATVTPVEFTPSTFTVWEADQLPITVDEDHPYSRIVSFDDVVSGAALDIAFTGDTPTTTLTPFGTAAKIDITVGAGDECSLTRLSVEGRLARRLPGESYVSDDLTSQAPPRGVRAGGDIGNEYLGVMASARGIAQHVTFRYGNPQLRPTLTVESGRPSDDAGSWLPDQFERDINDVLDLTSTQLKLAGLLFEIVGLTHTANVATVAPGPVHHVTTYVLQESRVQEDHGWFVLDSSELATAGTDVLAY